MGGGKKKIIDVVGSDHAPHTLDEKKKKNTLHLPPE